MQSYPSPSAGTVDGGGPFYSSASSQPQPSVPNSDELQITAQLSRGLAPMMNAGAGGAMADGQDPRGQTQSNVNHQYEHEQDHTAHVQAGHGSMEQMGGPYGTPDPGMAPRKRSKVSRACDECRRKKIRCDATGEAGDEQCSSCKRVQTRCQFSRVPMKRGPSKGYIKELADRLNTLEGAMQAGEIPVSQHMSYHESPLQRRESDEFSPPPSADPMPRKRTYSSVSGGEFGTPYLPQRPVSGWTPQDQPPRHLPQPPQSFSPSQPVSVTPQLFREPNYSPNGLQPLPQWRNPPESSQRPSSSFEGLTQESVQADHVPDWDDTIVDGYYSIIHSTYPLLSQNKTRLRNRLASCPPILREAFYEALYVAVRSFPSLNPLPEQSLFRRVAQLVLASHFENQSARSASTDLIHIQTVLLMVIAADNQSPGSTKGQAGPAGSVWLGIAVGLANSMKLYLHNQADRTGGNDPDSDEKLARRIWWSLVIIDRWHSLGTSSPVMVPDGSVVVYPEDESLLGESLFHLARLSIIVGHFSAAAIAPTDLPSLSVPSPTLVGTLLRGELERWRESLPGSFFPPPNSPVIHLCYWTLRILMELYLPTSESELLSPAMNLVTQLIHNSNLNSPLTYYSTTLAALTLNELREYEDTRPEAESGLKPLLESRIAPSSWDTAVREFITNKKAQPAGTLPSSSTTESKHSLTASQGLQHLAELATATEEGRDISTTEGRKESEMSSTSAPEGAISQRYHDLRQLVKSGYLSAFILGGDSAR